MIHCPPHGPDVTPGAALRPRHGPKDAAFVLNRRDGPGTFTGLARKIGPWNGPLQ